MGEIGFCNYHDILKAISTQLLTDITTDGGLPLFLVRALHNKLYYGVFFSLRCYGLYLDAFQLSLFISPLLYPFIIFALGGKKWRKRLWLLVLSMPVFFILFSSFVGLGEKILLFKLFYCFIAGVGILKLFFHFLQKKIQR